MAYIDEVSVVIKKMSEGIENAIQQTLADKGEVIAELVREQLWAGQKPDGSWLKPSYMKDPYFTDKAQAEGAKDVPKRARQLAGGYVAYKMKKTPPSSGKYLNLPPRDRISPNLYITGTYHHSISVSVNNKEITTAASAYFADAIKTKYGSNVLDVGKSAQEYLVDNVLIKGIEDFYAKCGW